MVPLMQNFEPSPGCTSALPNNGYMEGMVSRNAWDPSGMRGRPLQQSPYNMAGGVALLSPQAGSPISMVSVSPMDSGRTSKWIVGQGLVSARQKDVLLFTIFVDGLLMALFVVHSYLIRHLAVVDMAFDIQFWTIAALLLTAALNRLLFAAGVHAQSTRKELIGIKRYHMQILITLCFVAMIVAKSAQLLFDLPVYNGAFSHGRHILEEADFDILDVEAGASYGRNLLLQRKRTPFYSGSAFAGYLAPSAQMVSDFEGLQEELRYEKIVSSKIMDFVFPLFAMPRPTWLDFFNRFTFPAGADELVFLALFMTVHAGAISVMRDITGRQKSPNTKLAQASVPIVKRGILSNLMRSSDYDSPREPSGKLSIVGYVVVILTAALAVLDHSATSVLAYHLYEIELQPPPVGAISETSALQNLEKAEADFRIEAEEARLIAAALTTEEPVGSGSEGVMSSEGVMFADLSGEHLFAQALKRLGWSYVGTGRRAWFATTDVHQTSRFLGGLGRLELSPDASDDEKVIDGLDLKSHSNWEDVFTRGKGAGELQLLSKLNVDLMPKTKSDKPLVSVPSAWLVSSHPVTCLVVVAFRFLIICAGGFVASPKLQTRKFVRAYLILCLTCCLFGLMLRSSGPSSSIIMGGNNVSDLVSMYPGEGLKPLGHEWPKWLDHYELGYRHWWNQGVLGPDKPSSFSPILPPWPVHSFNNSRRLEEEFLAVRRRTGGQRRNDWFWRRQGRRLAGNLHCAKRVGEIVHNEGEGEKYDTFEAALRFCTNDPRSVVASLGSWDMAIWVFGPSGFCILILIIGAELHASRRRRELKRTTKMEAAGILLQSQTLSHPRSPEFSDPSFAWSQCTISPGAKIANVCPPMPTDPVSNLPEDAHNPLTPN